MKTLFFSVLFGLVSFFSFAQMIYVDPMVTAAMIAHDANLKSEQNKTNNILSSIRTAETFVQTQLKTAHDLQMKVYKGLSEVSSLVNDAYYAKKIYENCQNLVNHSVAMAQFAVDYPQFAVFANKDAQEFRRRATMLTTETVATLTGGEFNLMNSGQRRELLRDIELQTSLLASGAWLMLYSMQRAKNVGFWKSLNPFAGYINQDRRIAQDIINRAKYL